ncbi:MAG: GldM family protein, partial [Sediminibacterium sp.]
DIWKEFNSMRKMEQIFIEKEGNDKKSNIQKVYDELFELVNFLNSQPLQLDSAIKTLIPVVAIITSRSGKDYEWDKYLFLHKPVAVSYFHIKRIKLLLLDVENIYQLAALKTIGYVQAFYSIQNNTTVLFKQGEMSKVSDAEKQAEIMKRLKEELNKNTSNASSEISTNDELTKRLKNALQNENYFVGIKNQILKSLNYSATGDFAIIVTPDAKMNQTGNDYYLSFGKPGLYTIKFMDKRTSANKVLFDKKVEVSLLPNPLIRLNTESMTNNIINVRDLLNSNRLIAYMGSSMFKNFPGRINGYNVIKVGKEGKKPVYNYGDVFSPASQSLIGSCKQGDLIIFDEIQISMSDGTTRKANPMTFKIVE